MEDMISVLFFACFWFQVSVFRCQDKNRFQCSGVRPKLGVRCQEQKYKGFRLHIETGSISFFLTRITEDGLKFSIFR